MDIAHPGGGGAHIPIVHDALALRLHPTYQGRGYVNKFSQNHGIAKYGNLRTILVECHKLHLCTFVLKSASAVCQDWS